MKRTDVSVSLMMEEAVASMSEGDIPITRLVLGMMTAVDVMTGIGRSMLDSMAITVVSGRTKESDKDGGGVDVEVVWEMVIRVREGRIVVSV